ncbi:MAG: DUF1543 domain-containing protein [Symploca sp. SIO2E9]|nr:DUF1543 domain-containing protein [Symploca sp. SIO2E9]
MLNNKLFAAYLGGRADGCNIELHDIAFVVGHSIEDTYGTLARKWFGNTKKFHIDAYVDLSLVDGHKISPVRIDEFLENDTLKLFFINFGAYEENLLGEVHQSAFYVAKDQIAARARAKKELCLGMIQTHCDDTIQVDTEIEEDDGIDDIIEIKEIDSFKLKIEPIGDTPPLKINCGYTKIDAKKYRE